MGPLPLDELMQPVSYEEAETLLSKSPRSRSWHENGRMDRQMSARAAEPENVDPEALRDDFRRLLD